MYRKRRREEHEEGSSERWLVSYADFITLLFAFFAVLYATSEQNVEKAKSFEKSIKQHLSKVGLGVVGSGGKGLSAGEKNTSVIRPPISTFAKNDKEIMKLLSSVETYFETEMSDEKMAKVVTDISADVIGVRVSLLEKDIFPQGSAKFKKSALKVIDKMAGLLKKTQKRVIIEGHTEQKALSRDLLPTSWELASLRATTVVRYLIQRHQLAPERLAAISYGEHRPLNPSLKSDTRNGRIDFFILAYGSPL